MNKKTCRLTLVFHQEIVEVVSFHAVLFLRNKARIVAITWLRLANDQVLANVLEIHVIHPM